VRNALRVLAPLALVFGNASAQRTGALLHPSDTARKSRRAIVQDSVAVVKGDTIFAALVFDPSAAALARASAWTASVVPAGPSKEARVQANLCDIAAALCGARGASSLMFAGPFNTSDEFTELADLDGLVGSARVQGSFTSNVTSAGSFFSLAGTFSKPSFAYRDSAALARRSVQHAAYAIEGGGGFRWPSVTLHASVRVEQAYHAQAAQNVCLPASFGPSGTTACSSMVLGEPSSAARTVASVSGAWSVGGNGAARLTLSHDLRHSVTGIDLPVWVMPNAAGGLAGGVRFGYRTDARQMTVTLFVSEFKL
jgi:hypothetical protein